MHHPKLNSMLLVFVFLGILFTGTASAGFSQSDLEGEWYGQGLYSGDWEAWFYSTMTVNASGNGSETWFLSNGSSDKTSINQLNISNEGIITSPDKASLRGSLSTDKNIMVLTGTYPEDDGGMYLLMIYIKAGGSFTQSDLEGTWYGHSLVTGSSPGWEHSEFAIDASGDGQFSITDDDGDKETYTGVKANLSSEGIITIDGSDSFRGILSPNRNVMVAIESPQENEYYMRVFVKSGAGFNVSDLEGEWRENCLYAGDESYWERAAISVDGAGNFTSEWNDANGDSGVRTGTIELSPSGFMTVKDAPDLHGAISLDNMILALTNTPENGVYQLSILTRLAADGSYPLENVNVFSDVYGYDSADFPDLTGGSRMLIGAAPYPSDQVSVNSLPTGSVNLFPYPGWNMWIKSFNSPSIGPEWATKYEFESGSKTANLDLTSCTFRELGIPQNITINDATISWDPVEHATDYRIRWFPLDDSGNPETQAGPLAETAMLNSPKYEMQNPVPGEYAMRIEAYEFCGEHPVNKSNFTILQIIPAEDFSSTVYYPHVASNEKWETEICIVNPGNEQLAGTLQAFNDQGGKVSEKNLTLPGYGRRALKIGDEFANPEEIAYMMFSGDSSDICGYTKFYQEGQYRVAVPAVQEINSGDIYIPHIASNDRWWTGLAMVNTTDSEKSLNIEFSDGNTKQVVMSAGEHTSFNIKSRFGGTAQPDIESAVIKGGSGIIGLELFAGDKTLSGVLLKDDSTDTLYFPHVASNDKWWTGIAAYNPSSSGANLTVTPYTKSGSLLDTLSVDIDAGGKYLGNAKGLNLPGNTAWFKIDSSQPLNGFELFGSTGANEANKWLAGYSAVDINRQEGVFPKLDREGWTGIAFVNISNTDTSVTLSLYDDEGVKIADETIALAGYEKVVDNPENIFGGSITAATYMRFSSDSDVVGFQLNGSNDGMMLDGLPGM